MFGKISATAAVAAMITLGGAGVAGAAPSPWGVGNAAPAAVGKAQPAAELSPAAVWHTVGAYERLSQCQAAGKIYVALGALAYACDDVGYWRLRILD
ncbi:hypothetical protein ACWDR3_13280 [Streptomyces sp. NPDC001002]